MAQGGSNGALIAPGLVLIFEEGGRPNREAVFTAVSSHPRASISHDPVTAAHSPHPAAWSEPQDVDSNWLELLADGLSFDLLGLAPGPAIASPEIEYLFNCEVDTEGKGEAIGLFPGPHIAAGANAMPVVRTLLGLGLALMQSLEGIRAVCWTPARSAIAPGFFSRTTESWLAGGPFPALGMLGMRFDPSGSLVSEGLGFFIGFELAIAPALCVDRTAATRLAVRIVQELVGFERVRDRREFVTDTGEVLLIDPDPQGGFLRITRP